MPKTIKTHLYLFDDQRSFTEDIRKKFDDPSRYIIHSLQTRNDLLREIKNNKDIKSFKVAIISLHDQEYLEMTGELISGILKSQPTAGIIILCSPGKTDEIAKSMKYNVDAFIPHNANFIMRVHNSIKKLISEHNIRIHRKRRNRSVLALIIFLIISVAFLILAHFRFPGIF
jgi:DNA-binding NarL/FixJ family response regulator